MSSPSPEQLIGPAAAKALAERASRLADDMRTQRNDYVERHEQTATFLEELVQLLAPKAKPLPEVVTRAEAIALSDDYKRRIDMPGLTLSYDSPEHMQPALSAFVLRWLRSRLEALPDYLAIGGAARTGTSEASWLFRADTFKALTGRDW